MDKTIIARQVGARLREVRQGLGLSLEAVEHRSNGRWKAVVVGSYERADRAVTVTKLFELAQFYRVPVATLLPVEERRPETLAEAAQHARILHDLLAAMATSKLAGSDEDGAIAA